MANRMLAMLSPRRCGIVEERLVKAALAGPAHRDEYGTINQDAWELHLAFLGAAYPM
jgi:hypothetical protein